MTKEYRTEEQFDEIVDSLINGNFSQAADEIIEYGFYDADIHRGLDSYKERYDYDWKFMYQIAIDFIYAVESATEKRGDK